MVEARDAKDLAKAADKADDKEFRVKVFLRDPQIDSIYCGNDVGLKGRGERKCLWIEFL